MSIDEIWKIDDVNRFIVALADHVERKCGYGDHMDALSGAERVFFITQSCESEVNNGGFAQFFDNFSGNFSSELVSAFQAIGAERTAEICRAALDAFGQELPADQDARRELLDSLASGGIDEALGECDAAFYRYEEDLNALNHAYVLRHRAAFS